jgi:ADP-ribose pyrophosphatase YjhB (NUDIX family)
VPIENSVLSCPACGFHLHFNPAVAAGVIVQGEDGRVLLLRRALEPARGKLAFPGGFIDQGENVEDAVHRETREETGLEIEDLRFLGGWPNLYAWRGLEYPVLDLIFAARAVHGAVARARDEVEACLWLRPREVDPAELAFPSLRAGFERFRAEARR